MSVSGAAPLRDFSAPIASQVDVTPDRLAGDWVVVAGFADAPAGPVPGQGLTIDPRGSGLRVAMSGGTCTEDACFDETTLVDLTMAGPGRWLAASGGGWLPSGPLWVLWMDADNRTAVIGRPDGAAAWIMDRGISQNSDRVAAGRDIMEWFGYDLSRLEEVPE